MQTPTAKNRLRPEFINRKLPKGMYSDGDGLYLQVSKWLTKTWSFKYTNFAGKTRGMGLGVMSTYTLEEVREVAKALRQKVALGIDPIEERKAEKEMRRKQGY